MTTLWIIGGILVGIAVVAVATVLALAYWIGGGI